MGAHDKETIEAIGQSIAEALRGTHICIHNEERGSMKKAIENLTAEIRRDREANEELTKELIAAKNDHEKRIGKMETIGWMIGFVIAASWAVLLIWLDKLLGKIAG